MNRSFVDAKLIERFTAYAVPRKMLAMIEKLIPAIQALLELIGIPVSIAKPVALAVPKLIQTAQTLIANGVDDPTAELNAALDAIEAAAIAAETKKFDL